KLRQEVWQNPHCRCRIWPSLCSGRAVSLCPLNRLPVPGRYHNGRQEAPCNSQPQSHLIRLPHDCFQKATNSFYYDVGKCPAKTCTGKLDKGLRCKDNVAYCCGVSKMETRDISSWGRFDSVVTGPNG
uniref:Cartilage intermediate layer protein 1/2 domain-containing protein n=1 Tax=Buteo japonicus TaxID=224669 RepID=A0A8C0BNC1_9AVES